MTKARMSNNPAKRRHDSNIDRPNGASALALSPLDSEVAAAAVYGNRATRRLAKRTLKKRKA